MSCDVGEVTERLENELSSFSKLCHFTYVTTHSPTLPTLYLRLSSFSNPSVASPTSPFILQPFFHFSYVISSSLNSPGEPPMFGLPAFAISCCHCWPPFYGRHLRKRHSILKAGSTAVGKVVACAPGLVPRSGQVSWVSFFRGFSSPIRQMSGSFRPQGPRISSDHHNHP